MPKHYPTFIAAQNNGKLLVPDASAFSRYLRSLGNGQLSLVVKPYRRSRTTTQNSRYWAIITIIGEEFGYTSEEMHEVFKGMFLREIEIKQIKGTDKVKEFTRTKSTTELNTAEFNEYVDSCIQFAAENGIIVPEVD